MKGFVENQRVVFTGGPGAGKTTVLALLRAQGFFCVEEVARKIMQTRIQQGFSPRPEAAEFAAEIFAADVTHYDQSTELTAPIFFDRGIGDSLWMLYQYGAITLPAARHQSNLRPYHEIVFHFPAWEEIYTTDDERDQTFAEAVETSRQLKNWYELLGYTIASVPQTSAENRVDFILEGIKKADT